MDADVRSNKPGVCPRCGMTLVLKIPERIEYPLEVTWTPPAPRPHEPLGTDFSRSPSRHRQHCRQLRNRARKVDASVRRQREPGVFLPRTSGSAKRRTLHSHVRSALRRHVSFACRFLSGGRDSATGRQHLLCRWPRTCRDARAFHRALPGYQLNRDSAHRAARAAGRSGKQAHLFAQSRAKISNAISAPGGTCSPPAADLIDLLHLHPFLVKGGDIQFNIIFPRPGLYRIWTQFQRSGTVNTTVFTLPVKAL